MGWFRRVKRFFSENRRRRQVLDHFDRTFDAFESAGELRLAELLGLVFRFWDEDEVDRALNVLTEEERRLREERAKRRKVS